MTEIPPGSFVFGADESQFRTYFVQTRLHYPGMEKEQRERLVIPSREEVLGRFHIDPFEVTNKQFLEFLKAANYIPQEPQDFLKHWDSPRSFPDWAESFPVVWVSAEDADAYCRSRGSRLPREEEWEKAARGADGRYYPWGNRGPGKETAVFQAERPEPAGNRPGDASPYEVYDMGGNVSEWTSTLVDYKGSPHGVVRGGSYLESAREMFTFNRRLYPRHYRAAQIGFRCAAD